MRLLSYDVDKQTINRDRNCDHENIMRGTKGYLTAGFTFSEDWQGYKKIAVFSCNDDPENAVPLENDQCLVPDEVTDGSFFNVYIYGASGKKVIITKQITIIQK